MQGKDFYIHQAPRPLQQPRDHRQKHETVQEGVSIVGTRNSLTFTHRSTSSQGGRLRQLGSWCLALTSPGTTPCLQTMVTEVAQCSRYLLVQNISWTKQNLLK